ncbi:septum site-determining protein Ssd [Lolliginicoccus suaedae]|uniref:septum site-determining protein Ssd n=1 Tax=Lolliginicoccus suaedae TaxID=2605429 RepID=UPI0011EC469B|nr:septum site-determining protein Ssd [Lolliginicoccus suaedae]
MPKPPGTDLVHPAHAEVALARIDDPELLASARRITASLGLGIVETHQYDDPGSTLPGALAPSSTSEAPSLRKLWESARLVILDDHGARRCREDGLGRRGGIISVVGRGGTAPPSPDAWRDHVALGTEHVFELPDDEHAMMQAISGIRARSGTNPGRTIAVTGACGGAGATVFASALALAHAKEALVVDLDSHGCGIDLLLSAENDPGPRWNDIAAITGSIAPEALWSALPSRGATAFLAHQRGAEPAPPSPRALEAILASARDSGRLTVCDMPRAGDESATLALAAADLTVIVVPANLRACAAAQKVMRWARPRSRDIGIIVRGPAPSGLAVTTISQACDARVIATMRPEPRLDSRLDAHGLRLSVRSPLRKAALSVLADPSIDPGSYIAPGRTL